MFGPTFGGHGLHRWSDRRLHRALPKDINDTLPKLPFILTSPPKLNSSNRTLKIDWAEVGQLRGVVGHRQCFTASWLSLVLMAGPSAVRFAIPFLIRINLQTSTLVAAVCTMKRTSASN